MVKLCLPSNIELVLSDIVYLKLKLLSALEIIETEVKVVRVPSKENQEPLLKRVVVRLCGNNPHLNS